MLAWQNGSLLNYNSIANSLGLSNNTIKKYVEFLENAFLVTLLRPFHFNMKKRIVKSPKVYLRDTGILHQLLRINDYNQLLGNPLIGSSWEGYVINQIQSIKRNDIDLFFYRTHAGAEVDLVLVKGLEPVSSIEINFSVNPSAQKGMFNCQIDLGTLNNFIIAPIEDEYPMNKNTRICGLKIFLTKYLPTI